MQTDVPQPEAHPVDRYIASRQVTDPKFTVTAFCDLCEISRAAYYRLIRGDDDVGNALFEKIETATVGAIPATELYSAWLFAKRNRPAREAEPN